MNAITVTAEAVNTEHSLARTSAEDAIKSAEDAIKHAIRCGELLRAKKADLPHGDFIRWVKTNCSFAYSSAARYMKAAGQSSHAVEISSLRHLFPSGRQPRTAPSPSGLDDSIGTHVPVAMQPELPSKESSPTDGTNVPAEDKQAFDAEEISAGEAMEREYATTIDKVMAASEPLSKAHDEIKRLTALVGTLTITRDGYMNGKTEIVQLLKAEQRKTDRLRKEIERLKGENEALRERVAIMEST